MRTQVGIVGAGPAGLLLAHLLACEGVDAVILEKQSRAHVEARLRAGLLEQNTIDLINELGLGQRMMSEGLLHRGIEIRVEGRSHRIDIAGLTGGRQIMIYGQHALVGDLIQAHINNGARIVFEAKDVSISDFDGPRPRITFFGQEGREQLDCDLIAGCDGYHGICRPAIPAGVLKTFGRSYPFSWLSILADAPPVSEELIYARHSRGFALFTMRSRMRSRLYLQCASDEIISNWPDERIWQELDQRIDGGDGQLPPRGPVLQKGITGMRSFVVEPMQFGNLFLAGDAAHIVPPTGAKGMNLAVADVQVLGRAMTHYMATGSRALLDAYSQTCLRRVWRAQHFSWWMTAMLHKWPEDSNDGAFGERGDFGDRLRSAELDYALSTEIGKRMIAQNYAGLPLEWDSVDLSS